MTNPTPKRFRPRFSIRTLVIVVTLVCCYAACWGPTKTNGVEDVAEHVYSNQSVLHSGTMSVLYSQQTGLWPSECKYSPKGWQDRRSVESQWEHWFALGSRRGVHCVKGRTAKCVRKCRGKPRCCLNFVGLRGDLPASSTARKMRDWPELFHRSLHRRRNTNSATFVG